jgi:WD40 repeat protein
MWDLKSGTCKAVFEGHVKSVRGGVKNVILLKDGRILSWGPAKRVIMVWDGDTGKSLGVLSSGISRVANSFDPRISSLIGATLLKDGRILSWSADFTLYIWDGKSYELVKIIHSDSLEKFGTLEIFDSLLNEDYPVMRRGDWFVNANTTRISAINRMANEISRWEADGRPSLLKTQNGLICSKVGHRLTFLKLGQI